VVAEETGVEPAEALGEGLGDAPSVSSDETTHSEGEWRAPTDSGVEGSEPEHTEE
jgi:hypothetical protein